MKNYYYELFDQKPFQTFSNMQKVKCRVFNPNETQIEVFSLLITSDGYQAWTGDITNETTLQRRKEIENELNKFKYAKIG